MRFRLLLIAIIAPVLIGCAENRRAPSREAPPPLARIEPALITIGHSVNGTPLECRILGTGSQTVFILASIHGSEPAGTPLLLSLTEHLKSHPDLLRDRRVILLPVANPDGIAARTRLNARRVDLNRNFPASNFSQRSRHGSTALSEPESLAIEEVIRTYRPARIVSIHQPLACIDYDGPAADLAQRMAVASGLPLNRIGSLPGSLGSYAGATLAIPIITVELPRSVEALDPQVLWDRYGRTLLIAIAG